MATVTPFTPTNIVARALFNLDAFGYADFKLTGAVSVSVSDGFSFEQFMASGQQISGDIYTLPTPAIPSWTDEQLANITLITDTYADFINLAFSPVQNRSGLSPAEVGVLSDINISLIYRIDQSFSGLSSLGDDGIFGYPYARNDIVINVDGLGSQGLGNNYSLGSVTYGFHVLMHEFGHALGMAHPHNFFINGVPDLTTEYAALGSLGFDKLGFAINSPLDMDREYFSIMSYDDQIPSGTRNTFAQTPMILDVIALQSVYGEGHGSSGSGDDTITAGSSVGVGSYRTYFDTGGNDTINLANYASGAHLHMGTTIVGATHLVGVSMSTGDAAFMIDSGGSPSSLRWYYGEYENAEGSAAADTLIGNALNNLIHGGGGNDTLEGSLGNDTLAGGTGTDTARFAGARADYMLAPIATGWILSGPDGTDTLTGMEAALFSDQSVMLANPTGHSINANVITRGGQALPGVTAHMLYSATPAGNLFRFDGINVDTVNSSAGNVTPLLNADLVTTGNSAGGSFGLTFQAVAGASLQSFDLSSTFSADAGWIIGTDATAANSLGLGASKPGTPIAADTVIGTLNVPLPGSANDTAIIYLTGALLNESASPDRILSYTRSDMGATGHLSTLLPDANLAISLQRGTADYLSNGTTKPVTAADALDALKLSVGLAASAGNTWKELIAADINNDGRVTAADALEILKMSVGINTVQPSWVFVPEGAQANPGLGAMTRDTVAYNDDYRLASITGPATSSFTGILVGDVNNSWVIPV